MFFCENFDKSLDFSALFVYIYMQMTAQYRAFLED
jgi:hypothetical protein